MPPTGMDTASCNNVASVKEDGNAIPVTRHFNDLTAAQYFHSYENLAYPHTTQSRIWTRPPESFAYIVLDLTYPGCSDPFIVIGIYHLLAGTGAAGCEELQETDKLISYHISSKILIWGALN